MLCLLMVLGDPVKGSFSPKGVEDLNSFCCHNAIFENRDLLCIPRWSEMHTHSFSLTSARSAGMSPFTFFDERYLLILKTGNSASPSITYLLNALTAKKTWFRRKWECRNNGPNFIFKGQL